MVEESSAAKEASNKAYRAIFPETTQLFSEGLRFADRVVSLPSLFSTYLLFLLRRSKTCGTTNQQEGNFFFLGGGGDIHRQHW